jgi:hypothetical protein
MKDAAAMAVVMGDTERAERFATLRDEFRQTLYASIAKTVAKHGIDYIPGSVELGDFDPTSTSAALVPGGELANLPADALARTFERYYGIFEGRTDGDGTWEEYSPYEVRNVSALLRLGQKDRALRLLDWLVADRRPAAWNQWSEIAWRDPEAPRFIGDMPHTWVGAGFVHAVRSLIAYERESDRALVLAAGVRPEWVQSERGLVVRRLPTYWGVLNLTMRSEGRDDVRVRMAGDLVLPPGKIVVRSPLDRPLRAVTVNGRRLETVAPDSAVVDEFPADVVLHYAPGGSDGRG